MIAELDGEIKQVTREHRGVLWCPFCDRSKQIVDEVMHCQECHARFSDATIAVAPVENGEPEAAAPASRRRRSS